MTTGGTREAGLPWRVILIEDSPEDRVELRRLLLTGSDRRFLLEEAVTGAGGVAAIFAGPSLPDCVLLDYNLPDMDALQVLQALSAPNGLPVCPVVVITGGVMADVGRALLRAGAQDFVGKDWVTGPGLARAIENAAERWAMGRELHDRAAALRRAAARDALRLALSEATHESDPVAIKNQAAHLLGEHLGASRVVYAEVLIDGQLSVEAGYVNGVDEFPRQLHLDRYGTFLHEEFSAGRNLVVADVTAEPVFTEAEKARHKAAQVVSILAVPLLKGGKLVAILGVHQISRRVWAADEVALVEETAGRIWLMVERVRAEARLRESEQRLSQLITLMPSFTAVLQGPRHVFERANNPYYALVGRGPEILGKPVLEALPELAGQLFPALLDRAYRTAEPFEARGMKLLMARGPDGAFDELFVDFVYQPLMSVEGAVFGILVHGVDRTEQVRGEQALLRSQRELQALADNTPDILSRFDRGLHHVFVNAAVEKATRRPKEDFLGKTNREIGFPEDLCQLWESASRAVFNFGVDQMIDFAFNGPAGIRHYSTRLVPELGADGSVEFVLGVTSDVTERKHFERTLLEQDQRKDEFLATLAHELRNPLAPLRTGLQLLRLSQNAETAARTLQMMERQLGQMTRLIDDLLNVSRINSGKIILRLERISLNAVLEMAVEAARPLIDDAGHALTIELPDEPLWLHADPTRMAQMLANLLINSAKYTKHGGSIVLSARRQDEAVVISVTDNGLGIPLDMVTRVFDMFTQINQTLERAQGGLGIGLALVKRLAEMHGGSIEAHSDGVDMGSTFTMRFPLAEGDAPEPEPTTLASSAVPTPGRRILVVDDNVDGAETLAMLLSLSGYETRTAFDGPSALSAAAEFKPHVVFLDIGLPGMNGYEVARRICADPGLEAARLIALTGWGTEDDQRKSRDAGFDAHLTKPVEPAAVDEVLARFLGVGLE
ncbi:response regulator [Polaromonas sp.]|uniref:response regulator n=1 Tax=Polaromonas sp. TaxID=1869339 RepID=UPI00178EC614|nr:response regulator [Polaromonas sp.]NMM08245.1 response regulator [Polaromonas sp.]